MMVGWLRLALYWFNFTPSFLPLLNYLHFYFIIPASHDCLK